LNWWLNCVITVCCWSWWLIERRYLYKIRSNRWLIVTVEHRSRSGGLKMKTCYLTLCFVLASVLPLSSTAPSYPTKHTPALYVFGDSLVDCGNNNHLPTGGPSFLPYGIDFMHGKPTGRATNGKTVADFLGNITLPF